MYDEATKVGKNWMDLNKSTQQQEDKAFPSRRRFSAQPISVLLELYGYNC